MPYNIEIDAALIDVKAMTKQQVFEALATRVAQEIRYPKQKLIDLLMEKEKQAISGVGKGVAIPQLKLKGIQKRYIAMATLSHPVNFNALDEKPADLICLLLSPEKDVGLHLRGLSRVSRLLRDEQTCQKFREARDEDTLKSLVINPDGWLLAA